MSQDSKHGKWSISSSEDEADAIPPSGKTSTKNEITFVQTPSPPKTEAVSVKVEMKPEPGHKTSTSSLFIGSEARKSAASNQLNPVKFDSGPSPAAKRKKPESDGPSGWALSDSDDDEAHHGKKVAANNNNIPKKEPPKKQKVMNERPPSPHGRTYVDDKADFFESAFPCLNDTYGFYLNKVSGLERKYNTGALHIKDILSPLFGTLKESVQFNYCFDVAWMVQQYPKDFRDRPVLLVHGDKREAKARLVRDSQPYPHVKLCQAKLDIAFGTHHTKMMLLWYEEGFRVVILTSNMIRADWYQKTQGMWMSPLYPQLPNGSSKTGDSPTFFKRDLLEYLSSYRAAELEEWIQRIKEHDLSETRVYLIGSSPGRYVGPDMDRWGHLRLRKLLYDHSESIPDEGRWPVVCQFSSIGSMGIDKTKWLAAEFQRTLTTLGKSSVRSDPPLHLLYPSVEDVRTSLEGYPAGGSLPYSVQTAQKQLWLHSFFHRWKADTTGRTHAMPHIKTFLRVSPDFSELAWYCITSANLSKAAWGALEKNNTQIMVRSYELGVLFLPSAYNMKTFPIQRHPFPVSSPSTGFPVPFDLPPTSYSSKDQPWMWNMAYTQAPDTHGNRPLDWNNKMFQQCEEPRFTIEQIDLLQRLRRTGISQAEVLHALDTLEHLDRQHGHTAGHKASYMPPPAASCAMSTATQTGSSSAAFESSSPPMPVPVSSPIMATHNGLVAVTNGKLSPPRFPLGVVNAAVVPPVYSFEVNEEEMDIEDKVEDLMRRDSAMIKDEIKSFLASRRISQAVVAQVTGECGVRLLCVASGCCVWRPAVVCGVRLLCVRLLCVASGCCVWRPAVVCGVRLLCVASGCCVWRPAVVRPACVASGCCVWRRAVVCGVRLLCVASGCCAWRPAVVRGVGTVVCVASGLLCVASGLLCVASGLLCVASGLLCVASGCCVWRPAVVCGVRLLCVASGCCVWRPAVVCGVALLSAVVRSAVVRGVRLLCVASGLLCVASGLLCVASGLLCVASGLLCVASGLLCVASGLLCVASGLLCVASGCCVWRPAVVCVASGCCVWRPAVVCGVRLLCVASAVVCVASGCCVWRPAVVCGVRPLCVWRPAVVCVASGCCVWRPAVVCGVRCCVCGVRLLCVLRPAVVCVASGCCVCCVRLLCVLRPAVVCVASGCCVCCVRLLCVLRPAVVCGVRLLCVASGCCVWRPAVVCVASGCCVCGVRLLCVASGCCVWRPAVCVLRPAVVCVASGCCVCCVRLLCVLRPAVVCVASGCCVCCVRLLCVLRPAVVCVASGCCVCCVRLLCVLRPAVVCGVRLLCVASGCCVCVALLWLGVVCGVALLCVRLLCVASGCCVWRPAVVCVASGCCVCCVRLLCVLRPAVVCVASGCCVCCVRLLCCVLCVASGCVCVRRLLCVASGCCVWRPAVCVASGCVCVASGCCVWRPAVVCGVRLLCVASGCCAFGCCVWRPAVAVAGSLALTQSSLTLSSGISQSRISHWLLQQGSDLSEQKKRAFFRWYQLEKTNPGATLAMRAAPLALDDVMDWHQTPPPFVPSPGGFRLRRGSRFTWRKECLAVMESYFCDNQYPDEAKREEIATACNAVIQRPGKKLSDLERVTSLKVYNWFANRRKDLKRRANIASILESHGIDVQSPGGQSNSDEVDGNDFPDQVCEVPLFDKRASVRPFMYGRADLSSPTQVPTLVPSWFSALGRGALAGHRNSLIGRSLLSGLASHSEGGRLSGVSWSPPSPSLQDEATIHTVLAGQEAVNMEKAADEEAQAAELPDQNVQEEDIKPDGLEDD
uniref:Tyrosyl-DNA phosphodiesterase 1 n=1 Tax=Knipowitschia caucasica TaxID=637954 RepID=A0AAV2LLM8_KNICA